MGRRRKLLVPEARMALQSLKAEVLRERVDHREVPSSPEHAKPPVSPVAQDMSGRSAPPVASSPTHLSDKGVWTTSEAGKVRGSVGGQMIQRLVEIAKEELHKRT